jgi:hypothetical protein
VKDEVRAAEGDVKEVEPCHVAEAARSCFEVKNCCTHRRTKNGDLAKADEKHCFPQRFRVE